MTIINTPLPLEDNDPLDAHKSDKNTSINSENFDSREKISSWYIPW